MPPNSNNIFIDTNVLIGYFNEKDADVKCLQYLFSLKGLRLYVSSLSVAQLVSVFQKSKNNVTIRGFVRKILSKFTVLEFSKSDIENSLAFSYADMEDNIQYVISQKFNCFYFITNNKKDYSGFLDIKVIKPSRVRTI
jgi:predicted nucleic acid-binding protein